MEQSLLCCRHEKQLWEFSVHLMLVSKYVSIMHLYTALRETPLMR